MEGKKVRVEGVKIERKAVGERWGVVAKMHDTGRMSKPRAARY